MLRTDLRDNEKQSNLHIQQHNEANALILSLQSGVSYASLVGDNTRGIPGTTNKPGDLILDGNLQITGGLEIDTGPGSSISLNTLTGLQLNADQGAFLELFADGPMEIRSNTSMTMTGRTSILGPFHVDDGESTPISNLDLGMDGFSYTKTPSLSDGSGVDTTNGDASLRMYADGEIKFQTPHSITIQGNMGPRTAGDPSYTVNLIGNGEYGIVSVLTGKWGLTPGAGQIAVVGGSGVVLGYESQRPLAKSGLQITELDYNSGGTSNNASMYVWNGDPNGSLLGRTGDLCIDHGTPALWQATGWFVNNAWVKIGGAGSPYVSLTGAGQTTSEGALTQAGPLYAQAPGSVQMNLVVQDSTVELCGSGGQLLQLLHGGSSDIDITHTGTGQIALRQWGTGGLNVETGANATGDILISQNGTGGINIQCPGTGNTSVDIGQINISAPLGIFMDGSANNPGHGDISLHSPVFAWDGLIAQGSGVSVDAGQLYVQNASVYFNAIGGVTVRDDTMIYLDSLKIIIGDNNTRRLGFFNATAAGAIQQGVTGSRGGNVALNNLLIALAAYGLITNNTTP